MYDLRKITEKSKAHVLCGASRISDERLGEKEYSFIAKSPLNTTNVSRIYLPSVPKEVMIMVNILTGRVTGIRNLLLC